MVSPLPTGANRGLLAVKEVVTRLSTFHCAELCRALHSLAGQPCLQTVQLTPLEMRSRPNSEESAWTTTLLQSVASIRKYVCMGAMGQDFGYFLTTLLRYNLGSIKYKCTHFKHRFGHFQYIYSVVPIFPQSRLVTLPSPQNVPSCLFAVSPSSRPWATR